MLVEAGAALHAQNREGCTPLHEGSRVPSHEVVSALLNHGVNVNALDHQYLTPLYYAACKAGKPGSARVVDLLLKSGADETIVATDRRSPAHVVSLGVKIRHELPEQYEVVRTLLVNAPADRAWRRRGFPTMCRAQSGRLETGQEGRATHAGGEPNMEQLCQLGGACGEGTCVRESRSNWPEVVRDVLGLAKEGVFRTIVGFL
eukprot:g15608.t1